MKKLLLIMLLALPPASAQAQPAPVSKGPKSTAANADPCAPIGRTARGELVYSLKCESLPVPAAPSPAPQAQVKEAPPPEEPEARRSGLFGWSVDRRKPED